MAFITRQEADPLQPVFLQQVLQQRTESQVFICINTIVLLAQVTDQNYGAFCPGLQFFLQLFPEALHLIRIRRDDDTIQLLDWREGEHAPLLAVILVLARKVSDGCKNNYIIVIPFRRFFQRPVNSIVKKRISLAYKDSDRFSFAETHNLTTPLDGWFHPSLYRLPRGLWNCLMLIIRDR